MDDPWLGLGQPRLTSRRAPECLGCHGVRPTDFIPGMVMHVDHGTPLDQRWTGWFVTGDLGRIEHYGNAAVEDLSGASLPLDRFNWPSLAGHVDMTGYLSPYSDVAALLVFEHQMRMMNLLTRVAWTARIEEDGTGVDRLPSTLDAIVRETVDYMLFVDEPPFPEPVRGTSGFAEAFNRLGPFDGRGRSLRRLDLSTRLMRYPCSYLVYSPQFGRLPSDAHGRLYARLWGVLSGTDDDPRYADLSADDRQAIVEILRETKTDLPTYFQPLPRE